MLVYKYTYILQGELMAILIVLILLPIYDNIQLFPNTILPVLYPQPGPRTRCIRVYIIVKCFL